MDNQGEQQSKKRRSPVAKLARHLPPYFLKPATFLTVLEAFATASERGQKAVGWSDVALFARVHKNTVAGCTKFLAESGLIHKARGRGMYVPDPDLVAWATNRHFQDEEARAALGRVLMKSWFGQAACRLLSTGPRERRDLVRLFGGMAGATEKYESSLETLVHLLVEGRIACPTSEDGDTVQLGQGPADSSRTVGTEPSRRLGPVAQARTEEEEPPCASPEGTDPTTGLKPRIVVRVEGNLAEMDEAEMDQLEQLLRVLRAQRAAAPAAQHGQPALSGEGPLGSNAAGRENEGP